jgi:hypothetical protein
MSENNPAMEDLEDNNEYSSESSNKSNPVADIAQALETILSDEHLSQKVKITSENEMGLIQIEVLQAHFARSFKGYRFPSLEALADSKRENVVSVDGWRAEQIVEIFRSIQTNIIAGDLPLSSRLMGKR